MATNQHDDSDYMFLVPHTPREDAMLRNYEAWLREVDNPFFNSVPGIVHYANWRVCSPTPAVPYTHVDFMRIAGAETVAELAANAELAEFGANWNRTWGRYPEAEDDAAHLNGHLYLCRRLAGRRPTTPYVSYQPATEKPTDESADAEIWEVMQPIIGDARFDYLRVVPLATKETFAATEAALHAGCLGAALVELVASPDSLPPVN